ncbi:MAG: hypothetical protein JWQ70_1080 [Aeromicrobium sp.]|nr:hypothetical protein [Ilumatobacteraceae bacterium]MCW2799608.1 hypothetical protein [Aeromicrobium sp.]
MIDEPPARVRIQHQDKARRTRLDMTDEIDSQTALGEALVDSLIRAQFRLAIVIVLIVALTLGALPMAFRFVPSVAEAHIAGIPLPWLLLGFLAYPLLLVLGWYFVVHAERNEATFIDLLDQS